MAARVARRPGSLALDIDVHNLFFSPWVGFLGATPDGDYAVLLPPVVSPPDSPCSDCSFWGAFIYLVGTGDQAHPNACGPCPHGVRPSIPM